MRRIRTAAIASALLGLGLAGSSVMAGIGGTKHDFSGKTWGSTEICVFCHAPHNTATVAGAPLWNHAVTGATFTMYSSPTLQATMGAEPAGVSKLCMSCHDGVTALDSYGTPLRTGTVTMATMPGASATSNLGTNLGNDHPIGFVYDAALVTADGGVGLKDPTTLTGVKLYDSKVECATCHNVHDNTINKFLRTSNGTSALCLKCHNK